MAGDRPACVDTPWGKPWVGGWGPVFVSGTNTRNQQPPWLLAGGSPGGGRGHRPSERDGGPQHRLPEWPLSCAGAVHSRVTVVPGSGRGRVEMLPPRDRRGPRALALPPGLSRVVLGNRERHAVSASQMREVPARAQTPRCRDAAGGTHGHPAFVLAASLVIPRTG